MADRTLVTVASAALTTASALAFARVFDSGGFVLPTIGAAVLPFVIGLVARRFGRVVVVGSSLVAGLVYALVAVDGWSPLQGWPDLANLRAELADGWQAARTEVAPVTPTTGTILLLVGATWLVALVVDQMLERDATTGALVPPLGLFVVATALGADQGGLTVTLGFAVTAVTFLLLQHHSIVNRRRGRFLGRRTSGGPGLLAAGAALGAVAVLVGTAVAPAIPGANADPLLDFRGLGPERTRDVYEPGIPPVLEVGALLQRGARTEMFRVRAPQPAYWRLVALDTFDGNFVLDAPSGSIDVGLDEVARDPFVQDFVITRMGERWMPAAYQARKVDGGEPLVIRDSTTLVTQESSVGGLTYRVESDLPPSLADMTPEQIAETAGSPPSDVARFTELPDTFSPTITRQAREATAGAPTPFDQALALREHFRSPPFEYDPDARYNSPGAEDGEAVVESFLEQGNGFCVQFASAYTLMARALDIPARMVVGFTPGTRDGDEFVVTNHEAHAWPEVWLAGVGWTNMFDPTPPSGLPGGSDLPGEAPPVGVPAPDDPSAAPEPDPPPVTAAPPADASPDAPSVEVPTPAGETGSTWSRWLRLAAAPLAIAALVGAYVAAVALTKRRRRARRRDAPPARSIVGAWREALDRLVEARRPTPDTSTPHELADSLATTDHEAGSALHRLAASYVAARYGTRTLGALEVDRAWEQVVVFEEALEAQVPLRTRWRRRLRARGRP